MGRAVRVELVGSVSMWLVSVGLVVMRAEGSWGSWATTAATVTVGMAITLTMAVVLHVTMPGMLQTWHEGIDYGRRLERRAGGLPVQQSRRHLTSVR